MGFWVTSDQLLLAMVPSYINSGVNKAIVALSTPHAGKFVWPTEMMGKKETMPTAGLPHVSPFPGGSRPHSCSRSSPKQCGGQVSPPKGSSLIDIDIPIICSVSHRGALLHKTVIFVEK